MSEGLARLDPPTDGLGAGHDGRRGDHRRRGAGRAAGARRGGALPGGQPYVYRVDGNAARDAGASSGLTSVTAARSPSGLDEGALVVVGPTDGLEDGMRVDVPQRRDVQDGRVDAAVGRQRRMTRSAAPLAGAHDDRRRARFEPRRDAARRRSSAEKASPRPTARQGAPVAALRGVDLDHPRRRVHRHHGPLGLGQVDLLHILGLLDDEYEGTLRARRRARLRASRRTSWRACAIARSASSSSRSTCCRSSPSSRTRSCRRCMPGGAAAPSAAPRRARASSRWASATGSSTSRWSCRSASASAPRSRARWSTSRACSLADEPTGALDTRTARRSSTCCASCTATARRWCWSRTITRSANPPSASFISRDGQTNDGVA